MPGKVTHKNGPKSSVLRPRSLREKLLKQRQPPSSSQAAAAAAGNRRAWQGRAGDFTTSLLGDFSFAATPGPHAIGEERTRPTLPAASTAPAHDLLGIVVFCRLRHLALTSCSFASAPPPNSKAPPPSCLALAREAGPGPGDRVGRIPSKTDSRGLGQSSWRTAPGRVAPASCAPRPALGAGFVRLPCSWVDRAPTAAQAPHRRPPEEESWL